MAYTEEDKVAFARKDRMIVDQTCLERAIEFADVFEIKNRSEVIDIAETFYTWVFNKADNVEKVDGRTNSSVDGGSGVVPTPTKQQLEWLKKIEDKYGYTREDIWNKCNMYPGNKDEAVVVTKLMKG